MSDWALITEDVSIERKNIAITGKMIVGREKTCDIFIPKDEISSNHAEIEIVGEFLRVKDLGSSNGTFLNGERIEQAAASPGDELRFDIVVFKVDGPILDNNKTVLRPKIRKPDVDTDTTRPKSVVSSPSATPPAAPSTSDIEVDIEKTMVLPRNVSSPPQTPAPSTPDIEAEIEKTMVVPRKSSPAPEPEQVVPGVGQEAEETESGRVVMGVEYSKTVLIPPMDRTKPIYSLTGTKAPAQRITYLLTKNKYVIGRTMNNDIAIDEGSVSLKHAELAYHSGAWYVKDLDALNGTFINGEKIENSPLESGDTLQIGRVEFKFNIDDKGESGNQNKISTSTDNLSGKNSKFAIIGASVGVIAVVILAAVYFIDKRESSSSIGIEAPGSQVSINTTELWQKQLSSRGTPGTPALGDIDGDKLLDVVIVDNKGWLRAFSGSQGNLFLEKKVDGNMWAPPALHDLTGDGISEIAIASDNGKVSVFNGKGQRLWVSEENIGIGGVYNRLALHDVNGDKTTDVIVPSSTKGLVALDGNRGWEIWNTASITKGMIISAPLITDLDDDGTKDAVMIADSGQVLAVSFNGSQVSKMWEQQLPKVLFASPTFSNQDRQSLVIVATDKNGVIALDAKTGKRKWQANISAQIFSSPITLDITENGFACIIVADLNGTVYAINTADGKELWQRSLGEKIQASPALFGGEGRHREFVVLLDTAGKVHILNSATGAVVSSIKISGADAFVASAVLGDIDNNATLDIVVASQNATIYGYSLNYPLKQDSSQGQASWPLFLGNDSHGMY